MKALKEFMRKNAYKLVYVCMGLPIMYEDLPSFLLFGEIPFPMQEYKNVKNKMKSKSEVAK